MSRRVTASVVRVPTGTVVLGAIFLGAVFLGAAGCSSGSGTSPAGSAASSAGPSSKAAVLPGGEGETSTNKTASHPAVTKARQPEPVPATKAKAGPVQVINEPCPYLSNDDEAIAEGEKIGRSTVLTTSKSAKPIGCRFYLAYPDYHLVTEITVKTYPSEVAAFNIVAHTGGSTAESTSGIGDGAVLYRTTFYPPDGDQDWSCIFAKGKAVVTIHTDELHSSVDARNVAAAIVSKF